MKYKVTEKHPAYKEGLEITNGTLILPNNEDWGGIFPETITDWINLGWIEEIQEPEFTRKDMIDFLEWYTAYGESVSENILNDWIKEFKKAT